MTEKNSEKPAEKKEVNELKKKIQQQIDNQKEADKRERFKRRIDVAKTGILAYDEKNHREAVRNFFTYLRIIEDSKQVGENGLKITHFDRKTELPEILLLSGIYWDLAKVFDKTSDPNKLKSMRLFLDKFVEFTKGTTYQALGAESLRKYIVLDKARHRPDFQSAYTKLTGKKACFIATAVREDLAPDTFDVLTRFRDEILLTSVVGRGFVRFYYGISPGIARLLERAPSQVKRPIARALDCIAERVRIYVKIGTRPNRGSSRYGRGGK